MGKSKKNKRNDARGYGGGKGPQGAAAPSQSAASSKDVVVTKQTHEGIQSLVDQLRSSSDIKSKSTYQKGGNASTTALRFVPKLTKTIDRLIDLGFKYDPTEEKDVANNNDKDSRSYLEEMVTALGYGITLESALDWLCLNVPTLELPPLFTDGNLRNNLMQEERQGGGDNSDGRNGSSSSSLMVLKFVSSSSSQSQSQSTEAENENREEEMKRKELERKQQQERMQKIQKDKQIAKEKAEAEEREAAKKKLLEQYAEYHGDSDSEKAQDDDNNNESASGTKTPLSPQEADLFEKEKELNELEVDLGCEANNYMRSKQEMKLLRNQEKKLKQQVAGLRRKVENSKRQREKEESKKETETEEEDGGDFIRGGGFFGNEEEDEEENAEENTATVDANTHPNVLIDCPIPKGWTGTTPRKTLEDTCRKQRLGKPKFLNLGGGSSGGYKLSGINVRRAKKGKSNSGGSQDIGTKDEWIALTTNFSTESSLPDYLALHALYEIDSSKPLYGMFPPAFRSLWLSWIEKVQQQNDEIKESLETKKNKRIQKLLGIIEANHRTVIVDIPTGNINNKTDGEPSSLEEKNDIDKEEQGNAPTIEESWEDMDDGEGNSSIPETKNPSKAGTSLKREFLRRQSTKTYVEMLHQRESLPMTSYRSEVLETIKKHQVVILCAETVSCIKGRNESYCMAAPEKRCVKVSSHLQNLKC